MTANKTVDSEKEALLGVNASFYGRNDGEEDDQTGRSRSSSLADTLEDKLHGYRKPSRLDWAKASWIRWPYVLFWSWLNPILELGYKQTLTDNDLDDLPHQDKCFVLWKKLLVYDWSTRKTWRIILHAFRKESFYIGLIFFLQIVARTAQPLFLRAIVTHLADEYKTSYDMKIGIVLAFGLYLSAILQAFTNQHMLFRSTQLGMGIRNALSSTIYRHLLSINMSSLQQTTFAQILNLVANDTSRFEELWIFIHYLWGAPLETIMIFGLLIWIIGFLPTCFAFIIILLLIPVQFLFSRLFSASQQRVMNCSDKRIKAYNEILQGCHIMKMYNWEKPMEERVRKMREDELASMKVAHRVRAINQTLWFLFPCLMTLPAFVGIWLLHYPLKAADIFTTLAFFSQIRLSFVNHMPSAIERLSAVFIASERIDEFMRLKEKQTQKRLSSTTSELDNNNKSGTIIMRNTSFSWGDNKPCLSSLVLSIQPGQFVGIVGSVGAGKSSLLAGILGEMNVTHGSIQVNGSLSYAAQSAWIFADTLRGNILMGKKFDQERYTRVLRACCLDVDLKAFGQVGDLIMIGEKGVNLSGGQKARVSLARALYINADIYLLDEPLSAVDPRVARRIFDNCIGPRGLLKDKTRLLVTHQTHFLTLSDHCILLADGRIKESGPFDQLSVENELQNTNKADIQTQKYVEETQEITEEELDVNKSVVDTKSILSNETAISGTVSWSVWRRLFTAPPLGSFGLILLIIFLIAGEFFYDVTTYWLAVWSRQSYTVQQRVFSYFYIYLILTLVTIIIGFIRAGFWFYTMLRGAANEHNRMLKSLIYTSLRFFESNSAGRILNRASRDQYLIDHLLPLTLFDATQALLIVFGNLTIIILINPFIVIFVIIGLSLCWYLHRYYSRSNRQLKQLESITRSPVYALFSSSLNGLSTIRALKVQDDFFQTFVDRVDANTRFNLCLTGGIYWFGLRLDLIATAFLLMTTVLCVIMGNKIHASLVALILMCTLNMTARLQWAMRQLIESKNLMVSAERIVEYTKLSPEEDYGGDKGIIQTLSDWPDRGGIEFRNYTLRYRPELEPVLKNLNIYIDPNTKVGIIGRTGAGKSSLFQALFRLVERSAVNGEILIDGVDISRLKLSHLRSHLSIIPQTPVLFSGTLRYNLDPFEIYTDEECLKALEDVQLKHRVADHLHGLYLTVAESGTNFSVGECQLICVARAILKKSKILLIDEATANIDQYTDTLIQAVIRDKFRDRTILTIAHRLNTIAESDRVLVMSKGQVANFDTPTNILQ